MSKRIRRILTTSALFMMICAIFLAGKPQPSSAQNEGFVLYQLLVFCRDPSLVSATFGYKQTSGGTVGRPLMGTKTICVGKCSGSMVTLADALAVLPTAVSEALQTQVDKHQADAAVGNGKRLTCLGPPKPDCEKSTQTISCDCNGDGKDESIKSFESDRCSVYFTRGNSRCEDWTNGYGTYYYFTDRSIENQGYAWLESLSCPALTCHQSYRACERQARLDSKCLIGDSNCVEALISKCKAPRDTCLNGLRKFGPAPKPQPLPTPPSFRP